jgi:hypothetical protein
MDNVVIAGGTSAIIATVLLQLLKRSAKVPWISKETATLNAVLGVVLAGLSAAGVSYSFDFDTTTGDVVAHVQFNVWTVLHWLEHTAAQWSAQQVTFWGFVKPGELLGELVPIMREVLTRQKAGY